MPVFFCPEGYNLIEVTKDIPQGALELCKLQNGRRHNEFDRVGNKCKVGDLEGTLGRYLCQRQSEVCPCCDPFDQDYDQDPTDYLVGGCNPGSKCASTEGNCQLCVYGAHAGSDPRWCGQNCYCLNLSQTKLIQVDGAVDGNRHYFVPPAYGTYKLTHLNAQQFCRSYGLELATVQQACMKDPTYDSGHDCPNISRNQTFTDEGQTYSLSSWNVSEDGSFWLNTRVPGGSLRVTYSCGNNHWADMCDRFYPLCYAGSRTVYDAPKCGEEVELIDTAN